jgi:hypothetical protein
MGRDAVRGPAALALGQVPRCLAAAMEFPSGCRATAPSAPPHAPPRAAPDAPPPPAPRPQEVLAKRKGRTLTRRIILKSYLSCAPDPALPRGTPDVRKADGLPVFTGGARPGGR